MDPILAEILKLTAAAVVGGVIGNHLALRRDKRQELNEAAAPVRACILKELGSPDPCGHRPSKIELDAFEIRLDRWSRWRFRRAWRCYERADDQQVRQDKTTGGLSYADAEPVKAALRCCLPYTKPR